MSKVWFVTGSSRGLGRNFVEAALSRGDRVAATARSTASLDDLVAAYGDAVLPLEMDVTDKAAVFESVQAGQGALRPPRRHREQRRLRPDRRGRGADRAGAARPAGDQLFGAVWVIQAALPYLREQGSGHIIQLSSAAGLIAMPLGGAYHASKWALEALERSPRRRGRRLRHQGDHDRARRLRHQGRQEPGSARQRPHGRDQPGLRRSPPAPRLRSSASSPPATRPPRPRHCSRSSIPTTRRCGCSSARASTRCSSRSTPTGSRPGPTGRTSRPRLRASSIKKIGDPSAGTVSPGHRPGPYGTALRA